MYNTQKHLFLLKKIQFCIVTHFASLFLCKFNKKSIMNHHPHELVRECCNNSLIYKTGQVN